MEANVIEVEVENGTYRVTKPGGRLGVIFLGITTQIAMELNRNTRHLVDKDLNEDPKILEKITKDPEFLEHQVKVMSAGFEEFAEKVLPHLKIDGPFVYDDMPGEDQYGIFMTLYTTMSSKSSPFRVITPRYAEDARLAGKGAAHPPVGTDRVDRAG